MNIDLDSRDLIRLAEKRSEGQTDTFERLLQDRSSHLIYSMSNIMECCAPLNAGNERSSVMRTLNRLERMQHIFMAEALIPRLELVEAVSAFGQKREYVGIAPPFVPRFDQVISPFSPPATGIYLNYGLAHTVFELWAHDRSVLGRMAKMAQRLRELIGMDRARKDKRHELNFPMTVERDLALYKIRVPLANVKDLAEWIYASPRRCPAMRLGYEVYHKIVRNTNDAVPASDMEDYAHLSGLPYVDAITLDNRMRGYVLQVDASVGTAYSAKLYRNLEDIEGMLAAVRTPTAPEPDALQAG